MVTRTAAVSAVVAAWLLAIAMPLAAQEKLAYLIVGVHSVGPHPAGTPPDQRPWVSGGVVVYEEKSQRPIAWFGAYKEPQGKAKYLYLLIFKTPGDYKDTGRLPFTSNGSRVENQQQCQMAVEFAKKKIEVEYKIDLDEKKQTLVKQVLKIGGKEVKEGEPRLFVVDLMHEKAVAHPVKFPRKSRTWPATNPKTWPPRSCAPSSGCKPSRRK